MTECGACGQAFEPIRRTAIYCHRVDCVRARKRDQQRRLRAARPDHYAAVSREYFARRQARTRSDPEYRAHRLEVARRWGRETRKGRYHGHVADEPQYEEMFAAQKGVCAICRGPETALTPFGVVKRLAVDHDRVSGLVRALLCQRCNTALGLFWDDPERLQSAIDYLTVHAIDNIARGRLRENVKMLNRRKA